MSRRVTDRIDRGLISAVLSIAGAFVAVACSGDSAEGGSSVVGGGCGGDDCGAVGVACVSSAECASGSCAGGQCVAGGGEGGASGSGPLEPYEGGPGGSFILADEDVEQSSGGSSAVCVDLEVDFERVTPTVVLLIDRSGSMTQPFDDGRDRWETLVQTLTDPQGSLIKKLESSVRFGMALYTSTRGFGNGPTLRECPVLTSVGISIDNFSNMSAVLSSNVPGGDTPTAESMAAVAAELQDFAEVGPKAIILATDGDPDTCADPDANNDDASKAQSVAAVAAAYAQGISTHIISVGNEVTASHLEALAVAGAGGDATAQAYTALDTEALVSAFNEIVGSVRTCDFTLQGTVEPADAPRGTVILDGAALVFGDPDGWVMPDESTVRLQGAACSTIQADAGGISMSFPCDAIQIIPR
jgi:hypothetical protein